MLSLLVQHQEIIFAIKRVLKKAGMMLTSLSFDRNAHVFVFFHPGNRADLFIWENSQPSYGDLGWKNRDLGNRASPLSHMNTSKLVIVRRDLGNPARPLEAKHFRFYCVRALAA